MALEHELLVKAAIDTFDSNLVLLSQNTLNDPIERVETIHSLKQYIKEYKKMCKNNQVLSKTQAFLDKLLGEEALSRLHNKKATIIQRFFREAIANPYTLLCRQRLQHEFCTAQNALLLKVRKTTSI
ncbi:MAG: hypothetical protein H9536_14235 [Aphanizomenon flos-aquae Clear-A1]|nr:hypothetical protein [Aphanizomenon flos-aquae Clear-A1]